MGGGEGRREGGKEREKRGEGRERATVTRRENSQVLALGLRGMYNVVKHTKHIDK